MITLKYGEEVLAEFEHNAYDVEAVNVRTPNHNTVRIDIPVLQDAVIDLSFVPRPVSNLERRDYLKRLQTEEDRKKKWEEDQEKEDAVSDAETVSVEADRSDDEESELHENPEESEEGNGESSDSGDFSLNEKENEENE